MVHVVSLLANEFLVRTRQNRHFFFNILPSIKKSCTPIVVKSACPFRIVYKAVTCKKIKVVVLLVWQLQHGFTNKAKVSPNLTVAQLAYLVSPNTKSQISASAI